MKKIAFCLFLASALAPSVGSAQVKIDMNRLSCGDLIGMPADDAELAAAWLSGWYNQKANYTWIDIKAYHRNVDNIKKYCADNPKEMVMGVIEKSVREMPRQPR
jgi:hypothetical protein